jgi:DNA-binding XRE family transcriptional regulator
MGLYRGHQMTPEEIVAIQKELGLSDGKMAQAIGVTRQTWRNWRRGCKCPLFAQNAIAWMMELRRLSPANDNLPVKVRAIAMIALAVIGMPEAA